MTVTRFIPSAIAAGLLGVMALSGCAERGGRCDDCATIVVAAVGEPPSVFPPLVVETVGRDIGDLVWERLADLAPGAAPIDTTAFRPRLAARWERLDSLTWRFHLRSGARWQDGRPVRADDVVFSFEAFADSTIDAPARGVLAGRVTATAEDSATVLVRFAEPSPEQLYDATWHVRIVPRHLWAAVPRAEWGRDTSLARLVGSGPYRVARWQRGQSLELAADSATPRAPGIGRVVWRFASDRDAALNLLLAGEADLLESIGAADRVGRVSADSAYHVVRYPAAVYGFLAFNLARRPFDDAATRQALAAATDRPTLARALFGDGTIAPPGPMSQLLWIRDSDIRTPAFDTTRAAQLLASAGWTRQRPLRADILVPATSAARRQLAVALQESWRRLGVEATVTAVDFPVFQERIAAGRFDAYIGAYLDEPSPRGLAEQWTRAGWDALNFGHYANPAFDSLLARAARETEPRRARELYRAAMDTLNADAPGIFIYALENSAAVHRRLRDVEIDPYSWLSQLPSWRVDPSERLTRDTLR